MEFIKKHYMVLITIACWVLAFVFVNFKQTETLCGIFGLAAVVLTILLIVKRKKKAPSVKGGSAASGLPQYISKDGRRYNLAYSYTGVAIVGRQYYDDVVLKQNDTLYILQEPENPNDDEAVSVNVQNYGGMAVAGYIRKDNKIKEMANDFINRGEPIVAFVDDSINETMTIGFYK